MNMIYEFCICAVKIKPHKTHFPFFTFFFLIWIIIHFSFWVFFCFLIEMIKNVNLLVCIVLSLTLFCFSLFDLVFQSSFFLNQKIETPKWRIGLLGLCFSSIFYFPLSVLQVPKFQVYPSIHYFFLINFPIFVVSNFLVVLRFWFFWVKWFITLLYWLWNE